MPSRSRKATAGLLALLAWVAVARAEAQTLRATEAHDLVQRGRVILIDIRSPAEWRRTGLPVGATPVDKALPLDELIAIVDRLAGHDKTKRLAIICSVGVRSFEVRADLEVAGYARVIDVFDGVDGNANGPGWLASRLPMQPWPAR